MVDSRIVVFLDRDGVINRSPGEGEYVTRPKDLTLIPGSGQAIRKLNEAGFKICVISNQQGVGKKLFTQKDLDAVTARMVAVLKKKKAYLDGIYYCTHLKEENCHCRKPKTGLLERALADLSLIPQAMFFVGDSMIDVETAHAFGSKSVLVLSGKEKLSHRASWPLVPDFIFDNLLLAAHYICAHGK